jgi:hypothetical protein
MQLILKRITSISRTQNLMLIFYFSWKIVFCDYTINYTISLVSRHGILEDKEHFIANSLFKNYVSLGCRK